MLNTVSNTKLTFKTFPNFFLYFLTRLPITELQQACIISVHLSCYNHYLYPFPVTRADFTHVAHSDFMILSPTKGVRGGHGNGLVLHSWPHEVKTILQIWYKLLYRESPYWLSLCCPYAFWDSNLKVGTYIAWYIQFTFYWNRITVAYISFTGN